VPHKPSHGLIVAANQQFQAVQLLIGKEITDRVGDVVGLFSSKDSQETKDKVIIT
jgi:hypothetical protein